MSKIENNKMTKIKKWKIVFYTSMYEYPTWKNIKDIQFEDDDRIRISYEEPCQTESNYEDDGWIIEVEREMEETDDEYERRMKRIKLDEELQKKRNYETYLKLKKQFENE
jgi:hypothetical protein